ncbi:hypothetical protein PMIN06_002923 [Paraphaeosphaeria minitans]
MYIAYDLGHYQNRTCHYNISAQHNIIIINIIIIIINIIIINIIIILFVL